MEKKQLRIVYFVIGLVVLILIVAAIILKANQENKITRIIPDKNIKPGEVITIKIKVSVKNSNTYYALEEHIPSGWKVINGGGGITSNPNRLAWVIIENAKDTEYVYTVKAPENPGAYNPSGIYMFDDSTNPIEF